MKPLKISEIESGRPGIKTMRVTGFSEDELSRIRGLEHSAAMDYALTILDNRNDKIGSCWLCGYGVYAMWMDDDSVYFNIGTGCD